MFGAVRTTFRSLMPRAVAPAFSAAHAWAYVCATPSIRCDIVILRISLRGILNIVLRGGRRRSPVEPGGFGALSVKRPLDGHALSVRNPWTSNGKPDYIMYDNVLTHA